MTSRKRVSSIRLCIYGNESNIKMLKVTLVGEMECNNYRHELTVTHMFLAFTIINQVFLPFWDEQCVKLCIGLLSKSYFWDKRSDHRTRF